jgi:hypothetical protein
LCSRLEEHRKGADVSRRYEARRQHPLPILTKAHDRNRNQLKEPDPPIENGSVANEPIIASGDRQEAMNGTSRAQSVRHIFMRLGVLVSVLAFVFLGGVDLIDQWLAGHASGWFMLGTFLINAGTCLGVFGIIAAIGCVVSITLADNGPYDTSAAGDVT